MFTKLQGCKQPSKIINGTFFLENIRFFLDRLKDSTQIKLNSVKTFDIRQDVKHNYASQGITGPTKMQFFSMISFLNDSKFYDEERNELS